MREKNSNVSQVENFGMFFQRENSFSFKPTQAYCSLALAQAHIRQIPFIRWHPFLPYVHINMNDTFFEEKRNTKI